MRKTLISLTVASSLLFSTLYPANAEELSTGSLSSETEQSSSSTDGSATSSSEDSDYAAVAVGIVAILAVGGLIAGGINWAVQQRIIPNPLPGIIPNPPAPVPQPAPAPQQVAPAPAPAPQQVAPAPAPAPAPVARTYQNCTEVWNALNRPIRRGEAGYGSHLDRDGDGVGCESRPR